VKLRIPSVWEGRLHSAEVRYCLSVYLQRPHALPPDPGAGEVRVSLSVPPRAIKILEAVTGDSASAALRRLMSERLPALPSAIRRPAPAFPNSFKEALPTSEPTHRSEPPVFPVPWIRPPSPACRMGPGAMSWDTSYKVSVVRACQTQVPAVGVPEFDLMPSCLVVVVVLLALGLAVCWWLGSQLGTESPVAASDLPRFKVWIPVGD